MSRKFEILNWDTKFFGYGVAKISSFVTQDDLIQIIQELKSMDVRLAYCFLDPRDTESNRAAKDRGGFLADEKITFTINTLHLKPNQNLIIEEFTANEPTIELVELAVQSGEFSRYKMDQNFESAIYRKFYTQWIGNSVKKIFDNIVYVYSGADKITGMISLKDKGEKGSISLIAVDTGSRGKNIGTELINKAIWHYQQSGIYELDVVTQKANNTACQFYLKNGFLLQSVENVYHFWL